MSPNLGIFASQISGHLWAPSGAYDSIATVTVGSGGSSSISFTSIPSTYTHLQIRTFVNNPSNLVTYTQFNGDAGANYAFHAVYGDGTTAGVITNSSQTSIGSIVYASTSANIFFGGVVDILDYANTNKYKTVKSLTGWDTNGGGSIHLRSGLWQSTSAINSIQIAASTGTFAQYSSFALYGVK